MPKRILAGTFAAAVLGLGACDYNKQDYNQANADYGAEEANYADNSAAYDNMAGNMSNEVGNMDNGAAGNETANEATTNTGY